MKKIILVLLSFVLVGLSFGSYAINYQYTDGFIGITSVFDGQGEVVNGMPVSSFVGISNPYYHLGIYNDYSLGSSFLASYRGIGYNICQPAINADIDNQNIPFNGLIYKNDSIGSYSCPNNSPAFPEGVYGMNIGYIGVYDLQGGTLEYNNYYFNICLTHDGKYDPDVCSNIVMPAYGIEVPVISENQK